MVATYFLLACALAVAQPAPADPVEWLVMPRLGRGQELVYRGTFHEEALGPGVQLNRDYRLETRVFVLESRPRGADLAFYTVLKVRPSRSEELVEAPPTEASSVRLELAQVDLQGHLSTDQAVSVTVPLDGPPTIETGIFVEAYRGRISRERAWEVTEPGRPVRQWQYAGTEVVNNTRCLKLVGVQQSDDWDKPRADRTGWRRQDVVWLSPTAGYAYRVERTIERREPARRDPTQRSVARFELESSMQYPGQLFEDRRTEIQKAQSFSDTLAPLLPRAGEIGPKPFEALLAKITYHLEHQSPTPYREVIRHLQRRAEAGRRGESPPAPFSEQSAPVAPVIAQGKEAPDFVTTDYTSKDSARLRRWLGKPILMVFYSPASPTVEEVLQFAQRLGDNYRDHLTVLAFAMSDDTKQILAQRTALRLSMPILSGQGLRLTYAVESTPKLVVLDRVGVVRGSYIGWGQETPVSIQAELKRWMRD